MPLNKGLKRESTENIFASMVSSNSSVTRTTSRHLELRGSRGVLSESQSSNSSNTLQSSKDKDPSITLNSSVSNEVDETSAHNGNKTTPEPTQTQESEVTKLEEAITSPRKK